MGYRLFSQEWVEQFAREIIMGTDPERKAKMDDNYWNWIEMRKTHLNIRLALVLKDEQGLNDQYAYFDLDQGNVRNSFLGTGEIRGTADFILAGTEQDWYEIIAGPRELTQNMMYRKIRLVQGNLHSFFRNIYFYVEFLRCGIRVETEFSHLNASSM